MALRYTPIADPFKERREVAGFTGKAPTPVSQPVGTQAPIQPQDPALPAASHSNAPTGAQPGQLRYTLLNYDPFTRPPQSLPGQESGQPGVSQEVAQSPPPLSSQSAGGVDGDYVTPTPLWKDMEHGAQRVGETISATVAESGRGILNFVSNPASTPDDKRNAEIYKLLQEDPNFDPTDPMTAQFAPRKRAFAEPWDIETYAAERLEEDLSENLVAGGLPLKAVGMISNQIIVTATDMLIKRGIIKGFPGGAKGASAILSRAGKFAGLTFLLTPGTNEERANRAAMIMVYMSTPVVSTLAPTDSLAVLSDILANLGITGIREAVTREHWTNAQEQATKDGRPEAVLQYFLVDIAPSLTTDVIYGAMTKSVSAGNDPGRVARGDFGKKLIDFVTQSKTINLEHAPPAGQLLKVTQRPPPEPPEKAALGALQREYGKAPTADRAVTRSRMEQKLPGPADLVDDRQGAEQVRKFEERYKQTRSAPRVAPPVPSPEHPEIKGSLAEQVESWRTNVQAGARKERIKAGAFFQFQRESRQNRVLPERVTKTGKTFPSKEILVPDSPDIFGQIVKDLPRFYVVKDEQGKTHNLPKSKWSELGEVSEEDAVRARITLEVDEASRPGKRLSKREMFTYADEENPSAMARTYILEEGKIDSPEKDDPLYSEIMAIPKQFRRSLTDVRKNGKGLRSDVAVHILASAEGRYALPEGTTDVTALAELLSTTPKRMYQVIKEEGDLWNGDEVEARVAAEMAHRTKNKEAQAEEKSWLQKASRDAELIKQWSKDDDDVVGQWSTGEEAPVEDRSPFNMDDRYASEPTSEAAKPPQTPKPKQQIRVESPTIPKGGLAAAVSEPKGYTKPDELTRWAKEHGGKTAPEQGELLGKGAVGDAFELRTEEGRDPVKVSADAEKQRAAKIKAEKDQGRLFEAEKKAPAAKEQAKEPWEMTLDEWLEKERQALLADNPNANLEGIEYTIEAKKADWYNALDARAYEGRISDIALDDHNARHGTQATLRAFRGQQEKGIKGWMPKDVREQEGAPAPRKVTISEKPIHERTWEQHRKEVGKVLSRKLSRKEWQEERAKYDAAIKDAEYKKRGDQSAAPDKAVAASERAKDTQQQKQWDNLVSRNYDEIMKRVFRLIPDEAKAKDAVHTVLERLNRKGGLEPRAKDQAAIDKEFQAYVLRGARNAYADVGRKAVRTKEISLDAEIGEDGSERTMHDIIGKSTRMDGLDKAQQAKAVKDAIISLPDGDAKKVVQGILSGKSQADIGKEIGLSPGRVSQLKTLAFGQLRKSLQTEWDYEHARGKRKLGGWITTPDWEGFRLRGKRALRRLALLNKPGGIAKEINDLRLKRVYKLEEARLLAQAEDRSVQIERTKLYKDFNKAAVSADIESVLKADMTTDAFAQKYDLLDDSGMIKMFSGFQSARTKNSDIIADLVLQTGTGNEKLAEQIRKNSDQYITRMYLKHIQGSYFVPDKADYDAAIDEVEAGFSDRIDRFVRIANKLKGVRKPFDVELYLDTRDAQMLDSLSKTRRARVEVLARELDKINKLFEVISAPDGIDAMRNFGAIRDAAQGTIDYHLNKDSSGADPSPFGNLKERYLQGAFRQLYKESHDPAKLAGQTVEVQNSVIAHLTFLHKVLENGRGIAWDDLASRDLGITERLPGGQTGRKRFGELAGKYVTKEFQQLMMGPKDHGKAHKAYKTYRQTLGVQRLETLIGVKTIGRNYETAYFGFAVACGDAGRKGYYPNLSRAHKLLWDALVLKKPEALREMAELAGKGVYNPRSSSRIDDIQFIEGDFSAKAWPKKMLAKVGEYYAAIDMPTKVASYWTNLERLGEKKAIEHVHRYYQNADALPAWCDKFAALPLSDFPKYFFDSVRITMNEISGAIEAAKEGDYLPALGFTVSRTYATLRTLGKAQTPLTYLMSQATNAINDEDEDREYTAVKDFKKIKALRRFIPEYFENSAMDVRTWTGKDGGGIMYTINAGNTAWPLDDMIIGAIEASGGSGDEFIKAMAKAAGNTFLSGNMLVEALYKFGTGDSLDGAFKTKGLDEVWNTPDPQTTDIVRKAIIQLGSDVLGGQVGSKTLQYNVALERQKSGQEPVAGGYSPYTEPVDVWLNWLRMVRSYPLNKAQQERIMINRFSDWSQWTSSSKSMIGKPAKAIMQRTIPTLADFEKAEKGQEARRKGLEEISSIAQDAKLAFGAKFSNAEIARIIKDGVSSISLEEAKAAVSGKLDSLPKYKPRKRKTALQRYREQQAKR